MMKFTVLVAMIVVSMASAEDDRVYDAGLRLYPCYESASKDNSSPICGSNGIWYSNEEMLACAQANMGHYKLQKAYDEERCAPDPKDNTPQYMKLLDDLDCYKEAINEEPSEVCDNRGVSYPNLKMFECARSKLGLYELKTADCTKQQ